MPNNSSDNLDEVNPSPLTALLKFLCPEDPDEAQHGYLDLQRRFTGFFEMKGMTDPVADATETLDRAGSKILEGVPIPDINRFCMGIAKNIVHERLRQRTRENKAFIHF